jgi:hypothetical protein
MRLLQRYGGEDWHREALRVRMACLKLADGDLAELERAQLQTWLKREGPPG